MKIVNTSTFPGKFVKTSTNLTKKIKFMSQIFKYRTFPTKFMYIDIINSHEMLTNVCVR